MTASYESAYLLAGFYRSFPCLAIETQSGVVQSAPPATWKDKRLLEFKRSNTHRNEVDITLRVASFNVLADDYARTPYARDVMYPYCDEKVLVQSYRTPRLTAELIDLDCDLIGLQEWLVCRPVN